MATATAAAKKTPTGSSLNYRKLPMKSGMYQWPPVKIDGGNMFRARRETVERICTYLASQPECKVTNLSGYLLAHLGSIIGEDSRSRVGAALADMRALGIGDVHVGARKTYSAWLTVDPRTLPFIPKVTEAVEVTEPDELARRELHEEREEAASGLAPLGERLSAGLASFPRDLALLRREPEHEYDRSDLAEREQALRDRVDARERGEEVPIPVPAAAEVPTVMAVAVAPGPGSVDYTSLAAALLDEVVRRANEPEPEEPSTIAEAERDGLTALYEEARTHAATLERDLEVMAGQLKSERSARAEAERVQRQLEHNLQAAIDAANDMAGRKRGPAEQTRNFLDNFMRKPPGTPETSHDRAPV